MPEKSLKIFLCLMMGIVLAGCSSIKARTYVETKERVDQEPACNAGNLFGGASPQPAPKKTRQIYVLEVTQKTPEERRAVKNIETSADKNSPALPDASAEPSVSSPLK